jgi:hypothetical protein
MSPKPIGSVGSETQVELSIGALLSIAKWLIGMLVVGIPPAVMLHVKSYIAIRDMLVHVEEINMNSVHRDAMTEWIEEVNTRIGAYCADVRSGVPPSQIKPIVLPGIGKYHGRNQKTQSGSDTDQLRPFDLDLPPRRMSASTPATTSY